MNLQKITISDVDILQHVKCYYKSIANNLIMISHIQLTLIIKSWLTCDSYYLV